MPDSGALLVATLRTKEGTRNELDPVLLELSDGADEAIRSKQRELGAKRNGELRHVAEYVERFNEQACRLAATLQVFCEKEPGREITKEYAESGTAIAEFYVFEMVILQWVAGVNERFKDARSALKYLLGRRHRGEGSTFSVRDLCRTGPKSDDARSAARVRRALFVLWRFGHVFPIDGAGNRISQIARDHTGKWKLSENTDAAFL